MRTVAHGYRLLREGRHAAAHRSLAGIRLVLSFAAGSHVIAPISIYQPVRGFLTDYLSRYGVDVSFVSGDNVEEFADAIKPETSLIYLETPSSNIFALQDMASISRVARDKNIPTMLS